MCGRDYSTYTEEELHLRYLNCKRAWPQLPEIPHFEPNYNTCPTHRVLIFNVAQGEIGFRRMRWGLIPPWAKSIKDAEKYSLINARSEEIDTKRSFKEAFRLRRCIVPVSGFYEWMRTGKKKRPFAITLKNEPIMSLAGIWEEWTNKDTGEVVDSFAIITTAANLFMEQIHHRMPVILAKEDEDAWLDPAMTDPQTLKTFLKSCPNDWLQATEVSTLVNSPQNNSPDILKSIKD